MNITDAKQSSDVSQSAKARRHAFGLPILLLAALPLMTAAYGDGCIITVVPSEPEPGPVPQVCDLECEFGLKSDLDGGQYCECLEDPACIEIVAAPHTNPDTGECVEFGDVCNIPNGWEPCDTGPEGCEVGGIFYNAGDNVPAEDCGECRCRADGEVICEVVFCEPCYMDDQYYGPGESFDAPDGCNTCVCAEDGSISCTEIACSGCFYDDQFIAVGDSFYDGCNTCTCDASGELLCTGRACIDTCEYQGTAYEFGETFPAGDGCNTCSCDANGVSCTEMACTECLMACEFGFKEDIDGNQFCECRETDACIEIAAAPHFDPEDPTGTCIDFPSVCDIPNAFLPCEQAPPVQCDGEVFCAAIPPTCEEGQVPTIEGGCWGPCVNEELCR